MTDTAIATDWIVAQILASTEIAAIVEERVFQGPLPAQTADELETPYIIVTKIPGPPLTNDMADIIWFDDLVDIDIWDLGVDPTRVIAVLNLLIPLLHKQQGSTSTGSVFMCAFTGEIPAAPEVDSLQIEQHRGASFRIYSR